MSYAVIKASAYSLVHTPDMIVHAGTTQTVEKQVNPDSDYLKEIEKYIRSYEEVVSYPPNQVYIGNNHPRELDGLEMPWYDKKFEAKAEGKNGVILREDVFLGLMKAVDVFGIVLLEKSFQDSVANEVAKYIDKPMTEGSDMARINEEIESRGAEPLYYEKKVVGCVNRAHDVDLNLTSHVMMENLVVKASGALAMINLLNKNDIDPATIDYVIECSEEACGDMNQRGGGNFAKSIAEVAGCVNATGSDTRGFCAAPVHALIEASALVKAGVYDNVVIVAGGATAKLGMNGKKHVEKEMPILEDVLGAFAVLVSKNDGVSPLVRTDLVGKHTVGTGASPQGVISALVTNPLDKANMKITDIDVYSVEMQNPDITKPAGAGDVPEANYKMIGALGVKRGDLEKKELKNFIVEHGLRGWAPTQGHIPSGVPYLGFIREDMMEGDVKRAMIVGKGSLFLGRMTNLFDGVSVIVEKNNGETAEEGSVSKEQIKLLIADAMKDFASSLVGSENE